MTASRDHDAALRANDVAEIGREPGLSDPRLPSDDDQSTVITDGRVCVLEGTKLVAPSDEWKNRTRQRRRMHVRPRDLACRPVLADRFVQRGRLLERLDAELAFE